MISFDIGDGMKRTCKQCGKEFEITQSEINFYNSKNLALPKRCKECREKNKQSGNTDIENKATKNKAAENKATDNKPTGNHAAGNPNAGCKKKESFYGAVIAILLVALVLYRVVTWASVGDTETDQESTSYYVNEEQPESAGGKEGEEQPEGTVVRDSEKQPESDDHTESGEEAQKTSYDGADETGAEEVIWTFRSERLLREHYEKHGMEMGFASQEEYEKAASAVVNNPAALHKLEAEDGDDVYYLESTNEFVIVSTDGYIRTYFYPSNGIAYYNSQ